MSHTTNVATRVGRVAMLVGLVLGAVAAYAVCALAHRYELQELEGDVQRAREEFQDTMAESVAAMRHDSVQDTANGKRREEERR